MRRLVGHGRLALILAAILPGIPVQMLANRVAPRVAGRLPVLYHRFFERLLGIRVRIVGAPAAARPLLLVANHSSWLDIPVVGRLMPLSFVARADMAGWPGVGLLARLQRSIFVDRERRGATGQAAAAMADRLAAGDPIVLFAEGTTSDGNRVLPFRSALLGAVEKVLTGDDTRRVTIQPLSIAYVGRHGLPLGRADRPQVAWYGDMDLAPHALPILRRGLIDVVVVFGEPLDVAPGHDRKRLVRDLEARVREGVAEARRGHAGAVIGRSSAAPILKRPGTA